MNRYCKQVQHFSLSCKAPLLAVGLTLILSACGDGPGGPKPPQSPPRPITDVSFSYLFTMHMELPVHPGVPVA